MPEPTEEHRRAARAVRPWSAWLVGAGRRRHTPSWLRQTRVRAGLLALIVLLGLGLRLAALPSMIGAPDQNMVHGELLLRGDDSYRYLVQARDLAEGRYHAVNPLRYAPQGALRPLPPPLISTLAWLLNLVLGIPLPWLAALLGPLLGALAAWPAYLLGRDLGGEITGLGTALGTTLAHGYLMHTSAAWFGPDSLNLTLTLLMLRQFLVFGRQRRPRPLRPALLGLAAYLLLVWSWPQAPYLSGAMFLWAFCAAILCFGTVGGKDAVLAAGALLVCLLVTLVIVSPGGDAPAWAALRDQLYYLLGREPDGPSLALADRSAPGFGEALRATLGHWWPLPLSLGGLGWMAWRRKRSALVLAPLGGLALAGLLDASFLIYTAAALSLGWAWLAGELWHRGLPFKAPWPAVCAAALLLAPALPSLVQDLRPPDPYWLTSREVNGMGQFRHLTPPEAIIWASREEGFAINYWARRATINDAGGRPRQGLLAVCNFLPLATRSEREATNFMRFYVVRGLHGVRRVADRMGGDMAGALNFCRYLMSMGPQEAWRLLPDTQLMAGSSQEELARWVTFFFPAEAPPLYLMLDRRLGNTLPSWWSAAVWPQASEAGARPGYGTVVAVARRGSWLVAPGEFSLDLEKGGMRLTGKAMPVTRVGLWADQQEPWLKQYPHSAGAAFEAFLQRGYGVVMHPVLADTMMNRLYLRHSFTPPYLTPTYLDSPWCQLWQVRGDSSGD